MTIQNPSTNTHSRKREAEARGLCVKGQSRLCSEAYKAGRGGVTRGRGMEKKEKTKRNLAKMSSISSSKDEWKDHLGRPESGDDSTAPRCRLPVPSAGYWFQPPVDFMCSVSTVILFSI